MFCIFIQNPPWKDRNVIDSQCKLLAQKCGHVLCTLVLKNGIKVCEKVNPRAWLFTTRHKLFNLLMENNVIFRKLYISTHHLSWSCSGSISNAVLLVFYIAFKHLNKITSLRQKLYLKLRNSCLISTWHFLSNSLSTFPSAIEKCCLYFYNISERNIIAPPKLQSSIKSLLAVPICFILEKK